MPDCQPPHEIPNYSQLEFAYSWCPLRPIDLFNLHLLPNTLEFNGDFQGVLTQLFRSLAALRSSASTPELLPSSQNGIASGTPYLGWKEAVRIPIPHGHPCRLLAAELPKGLNHLSVRIAQFPLDILRELGSFACPAGRS
jgi:hypothetical protein